MGNYFFKLCTCILLLTASNSFVCIAESDKDLFKRGNAYFETADYQKALKEYSLISTDYKKTHTDVAYYEIYCLLKYTALHKADSIRKQYDGVIATPKKQKPFSEILSFLTTGLHQYDVFMQESQKANNTKSYQTSLQFLNKAIGIDSVYIDAYVGRAYANLSLENYKDCIADCNNVLKKDVNNAPAYYYKGMVHYNLKNYPEAEKCFTKSLLIDPWENTYYHRACTYYCMNEYQKSFQDVNEIIKKDKTYALAFNLRAALNKNVGKYGEALKDYETAIALGEETAETYLYKGDCLLNLDKDSLALISIDKSLSMKPSAYGYYLKARCLVSAGDYYDKQTHINALKYYDLAIKNDSSIFQYYYERGVSRKCAKLRDEAIADFSKAIKLNNLDFDSYYERNTCHELKGSFYRIRKKDLYEGINAYKADVIKNPGGGNGSYVNMAKCYDLIWDFTKDKAYIDTAYQVLSIYIRKNPTDAAALYERGLLFYSSLYDYDKAIEDLQLALKYDSTHYLTYTNLGWAYMHTDRPEKAYEIFILMKKQFPKSHDVIDGYIAEARKRIKK